MKHLSAFFGTTILLVAAANQVRADYLNWTYTSNLNVPGISVGNNNSSNGGASVTLTEFNNPQPGGTSIPVIAYVTSTDSTTPISFNNSTYNLALTITDSNQDSGTLNFTGHLNGSLTATTSTVLASFTPVTTNSLTFDGHTYTVNIPSVTLAPPTVSQQNIMASVSVANASSGGTPPPGNNNGGGGGVHSTPEPASLLLSSVGFSCLALRCWWKRRRLTRTLAAV